MKNNFSFLLKFNSINHPEFWQRISNQKTGSPGWGIRFLFPVMRLAKRQEKSLAEYFKTSMKLISDLNLNFTSLWRLKVSVDLRWERSNKTSNRKINYWRLKPPQKLVESRHKQKSKMIISHSIKKFFYFMDHKVYCYYTFRVSRGFFPSPLHGGKKFFFYRMRQREQRDYHTLNLLLDWWKISYICKLAIVAHRRYLSFSLSSSSLS